MLKTFGPQKAAECLDCGIVSAKALIRFESQLHEIPTSEQKMYQNWIDISKNHFKKLQDIVDEMEEDLSGIQDSVTMLELDETLSLVPATTPATEVPEHH
jgi:hypothetical protein